MISDALRKDAAIRVADKAVMEPLAGNKTITPQAAGAAMKVRYVLTFREGKIVSETWQIDPKLAVAAAY